MAAVCSRQQPFIMSVQLDFKKITQLKNFLNQVKRNKINFILSWDYMRDKENGGTLDTLSFRFKIPEFKVTQLADLLSLFKMNFQWLAGEHHYYTPSDDALGDFGDTGYYAVNDYNIKEQLKGAPNFKYQTNLSLTGMPCVISVIPTEAIVNGVTYRIIKGRYGVRFIASHMDKVYDYLDQFNLFQTYEYVEKNKAIGKYVVANVFTYEVMLVFMLCQYSSKFPDMLENGFFINSKKADIYRLRMEKSLTQAQKDKWKKALKQIEEEYATNTTLIFAEKLASGQAAKGEFNSITFTPDTATYHTVSLQYPELFKKFTEHTSIMGEFDIYTVARMIAQTEAANIEDAGTKVENRVKTVTRRSRSRWRKREPWTEDVKTEISVLDPSKFTDGVITMPTFTINNIPLTLTKHEKSGHRKINGIRINADEIEEVIFRASCFQDAVDYTNFLKQTSVLNLKNTDAISCGLGIKIDKDYPGRWEDPIPHPECTKLYFRVINKKVHLLIGGGEENVPEVTVPVKLNMLVKKVAVLNRQANGNSYDSGGYNYQQKRDIWAREKIKPILKEATTFQVKTKNEAGEEIVTDVTHINDENLTTLIDFVDAKHAAALKKSEEFLKMAIEATGAKLITRQNRKFYHVVGKLTEYYVDAENCKVFNAKDNGYVCIVNTAHTGVGQDDLAARIYALYNDSVLTDEIYTLRAFVSKAKPTYAAVDAVEQDAVEVAVAPEEEPAEEVVAVTEETVQPEPVVPEPVEPAKEATDNADESSKKELAEVET